MQLTISLPEWVLAVQNMPYWGWIIVWYILVAMILRFIPDRVMDINQGERVIQRFVVWGFSPIIVPIFIIALIITPGLLKDE